MYKTLIRVQDTDNHVFADLHTRDLPFLSLPLTCAGSLRVLGVTLRTATRVRAVGVEAQLPLTAHIRVFRTLVHVTLALTSGPPILTDTTCDGVTGPHAAVARADPATPDAVPQTGTRVARTLVAAHHVTHIARADEAALRVHARLTAHAFLAFVSVHARAVVAGVQLVTAVAEALSDGVARRVCGGGTAVVAASSAAQVRGGVVCLTGT